MLLRERITQLSIKNVPVFILAGLLLGLVFLGLGPDSDRPAGSNYANVYAAMNEGASEILFTVLHTNDEHSSLIPRSPAVDYHPEADDPSVGGFARFATAVAQIRHRKESIGQDVLLFSSGDFIGGSAYGWLIPRGYATELTLMQAIGYDAVTVGNHEYDFGSYILADYLKKAGYPEAHQKTAVLASNTILPDDHPLNTAELLKNTHIIETNKGLQVGVFGLIGKTAVIFAAANAAPVEFSDQIESARKAVEDLKNQGADIIIALSHSGVEEDRVLAQEIPEINIIISGHSHTALYEPVIEGQTIIAQAGCRMRYFGMLELAYSPQNGEVRLLNNKNGQPYLIPINDSFPPNPEIDEMIKGFTKSINQVVYDITGGAVSDIMETIATSEFALSPEPPLQETGFANLITDGIRLITSKKTGEDVAVAVYANGNIRGDLFPGSMDHSKGLISFYDLTEQIGLGYDLDGDGGYPVVSFYLTGDEIRRMLEVAVFLAEMYGDSFFLQFSGLRYNYDPARAVLFNVPVLNLPIPSTRAVISAEIYTGDGMQTQNDDDYIPLKWGDENLYRVATDSYILSYLPLVGERLPMLNVVPKDRDGYPLSGPDDAVLRVEGRTLKVWQAVVEYVGSLEKGLSDYPAIPAYYKTAAGRINQVEAFPLLVWPLLAILLIAIFIALLIRRRKRRQGSKYKILKR